MPIQTSPFLTPDPTATADTLSILHLKRDLFTPTILRTHDNLNEGYAEGKVTNTRFGSFPHSTLIDQPWGSQIRASNVDTGTRGRKGWAGKDGKKRKREDAEVEKDDGEGRNGTKVGVKAATAASTGFTHLLPPTPELWTASLPHRTQVVYTPDYSYILHRLRVRPGSIIIEAGAGSGSFTHAAARAVFNGYPPKPSTQNSGTQTDDNQTSEEAKKQYGKVFSFEFHKPRFDSLESEIKDHGLEGIVELTHRDVCEEGFMLDADQETSPNANAVFLDLPAPWLAVKHLTRRLRRKPPKPESNASEPEAIKTEPITPPPTIPNHPALQNSAFPEPSPIVPATSSSETPISPLSTSTTTHLCTFSPCIEQVQRTVRTLRQLGWHSISLVELSAHRIETHRQRIGLHEEGLRGVNPSPANVEEAVSRLREVEGRSAHFHELERRRRKEEKEAAAATAGGDVVMADGADKKEGGDDDVFVSKAERLQKIKEKEKERKLYKEGRLIHRSEPELKTHTSYLVFAVLPMEWSEEDERQAQERWSESSVEEKEVGKREQATAAEEKEVGKEVDNSNQTDATMG